MADFRTVCRVDEIREGEGRAVECADKLVALFRVEGQFFAIDDVCPHMGGALSEGYVEKGIVTCPWQAWRFRLADGAWADNPRIKIGCHSVRVEGDQVQVRLSDPPPPRYPPKREES